MSFYRRKKMQQRRIQSLAASKQYVESTNDGAVAGPTSVGVLRNAREGPAAAASPRPLLSAASHSRPQLLPGTVSDALIHRVDVYIFTCGLQRCIDTLTRCTCHARKPEDMEGKRPVLEVRDRPHARERESRRRERARAAGRRSVAQISRQIDAHAQREYARVCV